MPRNVAQLTFPFAEPVLPWLAAPATAPVRAVAVPKPVVDDCGVIDYGPVIDHVMATYGSEGYERTMRLMRWHGGRPNGHGCYEQAIEVDLAHAGRAAAIATAAVTGRGHWICGYDLRSGASSEGEAPNVWVQSGAITRDAALRDLARRVMPWFAQIEASRISSVKECVRRDAGKVIDQLRAYADAA